MVLSEEGNESRTCVCIGLDSTVSMWATPRLYTVSAIRATSPRCFKEE